MSGYLASTCGDSAADLYDVMYPAPDPHAVDLLATLAGDGPVLELGIGTGLIPAAAGLPIPRIEV